MFCALYIRWQYKRERKYLKAHLRIINKALKKKMDSVMYTTIMSKKIQIEERLQFLNTVL